jgi:hypothetical protein
LWAGEVTGVPNNVYEFSPDGQQIGSFDISGPAGSNGPNGLAYYNDSVWVGTGGTLVALDTNGKIKERIDDEEMSYSGLAGTDNALYGPDANGNLTILLGDDDGSDGTVDFGVELQQQATVEKGSTASITVYPTNNAGTVVKDATLELLVDTDGDGSFTQTDVVAAREVTFDAAESREINMSYPDVQLATGEYQYQARITAQGDTTTSYTNGTLTVQSAGSTEISAEFQPTTVTTSVGGTTQIEIQLRGVDNGVGSYAFDVSVGSANTATITDVSLAGTTPEDELTEVTYSEDNSSLSVQAANASQTNGRIATITVSGSAPGTTLIGMKNLAVGDEAGAAYTIQSPTNGTLTVTDAPQVVGEPAQDPDGDGIYEDVNGDGTFNVVDVQALFQNYRNDVVQNNKAFFDINENGEVNIVDVQALFAEL